MSDIERKILENLLHNELYARKIIPFIELDYFVDSIDRTLAQEIVQFFAKYNKLPTKDIISIELSNRKNLSDELLTKCNKLLKSLEVDDSNIDWLLKHTEKYFKDRAVYNAILKSLTIINNEDKVLTPEAIPKILQDALGVSFDKNVGHDYFIDAEARYDFYNRREEKIPFDINLLNKITDGGMSKKSLTIFLAMTGLGKTLVMCHMAASAISQGKNVLYITLEMAEERIAQRIDANLLNIDIKDLVALSKESFNKRIDKLRDRSNGKLVIKEYPTSSAHAGHFRVLLEELKTKKNFQPDLIVVDYLGICSSSRIKMSSGANSYLIVKSIAEELRGLAMEYNVPVISGAQTNKCLVLNTLVEHMTKGKIPIKDLVIGDKILGTNGFVDVNHIFPIEENEVYEIVLKSGKKIKCSKKHIFPTIDGMKSIDNLLQIGDYLFVNNVISPTQ
uniref:DNA 5'-3' helicase DnaB n=1 Tax=viral metagenome TaxID=1070528 RepID=A0A6C0JU67_9ZZZZ